LQKAQSYFKTNANDTVKSEGSNPSLGAGKKLAEIAQLAEA